MSKENSRERIIQLTFGTYPEVTEFNFTSDNQAFTEVSDAKNHASQLDDKTVELIKRSDLKKIAKVEDKAVEGQSIGGESAKTETKTELDVERAALAKRYAELLEKKPAHNAGILKLKEAIEKAEAELASKESDESTKRTITQEDLDANPDLVEEGVKVGDPVEISAE